MAQVCEYLPEGVGLYLAPFFWLGEVLLPAKLLWTESEARDTVYFPEVWKAPSLTKCDVGWKSEKSSVMW